MGKPLLFWPSYVVPCVARRKEEGITGCEIILRLLLVLKPPKPALRAVGKVWQAVLSQIDDNNFHGGFLSLVTSTSVFRTDSTPSEMDRLDPSQRRVPARHA